MDQSQEGRRAGVELHNQNQNTFYNFLERIIESTFDYAIPILNQTIDVANLANLRRTAELLNDPAQYNICGILMWMGFISGFIIGIILGSLVFGIILVAMSIINIWKYGNTMNFGAFASP